MTTPSTPAVEEPTAQVSAPDEPPTPEEQQFLRLWLQYTQSMHNRLQEINSPWAPVMAQVGAFIDDILAPEEEP